MKPKKKQERLEEKFAELKIKPLNPDFKYFMDRYQEIESLVKSGREQSLICLDNSTDY